MIDRDIISAGIRLISVYVPKWNCD